MSGNRDDAAGGSAGSSGPESGGLPPQAPAYDFRTGQPLDRPLGSGSRSDEDDLGIWAPGQADEADTAGYDYGVAPDDTTATGGAGTYPQLPAGPTSDDRPQFGQVGYSQPSYSQPSYSQSDTGPGVPTQVPTSPGYGQAPYPGYGTSGTTPTLTGPGPGQGPDRSRRGLAVLGGVVGVLAVVVAVLVTVLLVGGSSDDTEPTAASGSATPGASAPSAGAGVPSGSTNGGAGSGGTGSSGGTGASGARAAFVRSVDGILTESASGRSQVSSAVNGVNNGCSVSPESAASTMQSVIDNRTSVLAQASALDAPDAATAAVQADLVRALESSIEANRGYLQWFEDLQAEYPDEIPAGCPTGSAPQNISYDEATAASGRATAAKQSFVAGYNPLASAAGQRTWSESEF